MVEVIGVVWLIDVFTVVVDELFVAVVVVKLTWAWAKIFATSGERFSNDNDERPDETTGVEATAAAAVVVKVSVVVVGVLSSDETSFLVIFAFAYVKRRKSTVSLMFKKWG